MILRMLRSVIKEHGGQGMPSMRPTGAGGSLPGCLLRPAACRSSNCRSTASVRTRACSSWLSASAAMSRQVSGHAMLSQVAAVHGIAACGHVSSQVSRRHCHSAAAAAFHGGPSPDQQQQPCHSLLHHQQQPNHYQVGQHKCAGTSSTYQSPSAAAPAFAAAAAASSPLQPDAASQQRGTAAPTLPQQLLDHSSTRQQRSSHGVLAAASRSSGGRGSLPGHWSHTVRPVAAAAAGAGDGQLMAASQGGAGAWAASSAGGAGYGGINVSPGWQAKRTMAMTPQEKHLLLLEKLEEEWGEQPPAELTIGEHRCVCPCCGNGKSGDDAFAVKVEEDCILWHCFRASCGYNGGVSVFGGRDASSSSAAAAAGAVAEAARQSAAARGGPLKGSGDASAASATKWLQEQQRLLEHKPPGGLATNLKELSPLLLAWFKGRCISPATLQRNGVKMELRYCRALDATVEHIAFPYRKNGAVVNIKYRALEKYFSQTKGGEQIFYGYDDAQGACEVIIVEGEMDKLALEEALYVPAGGGAADDGAAAGDNAAGDGSAAWQPAILSVPAGAPAPGSADSAPAGNLERKFRYVHTCSDILHSVERVILAVDSDGPGVVLADELARRIGREKCWRVTWPTGPHDSLAPGAMAAAAAVAAGDAAAAAAAGDWARKDANEVLMKDGPEVLRAYIEAAQPLPIRGLFRFDEFWPQVYDLYQQGPRGLSWGVSTGWESVDTCYKVVPGELTIVTGLPNSGKSEWLDALAVNLARQHGWRMALCSMENSAKEHGRKLMEKYTGKAFFNAAYSIGTSKMDFNEVLDALVWIDTHFHIIRPPPDQLPSIDYILDKARAAVLRYGIHGLVIDPYNELDHRRPSMFSETEHVSQLLTKIKRFAQHYDCHVWFVAHPRTQRGLGLGGGTASLSAPSMYDISGSANFINKADNGIVVHRPHTGGMEGKDPYAVQLLVRKVRNKLAGKIGDVMLHYDRATGCYECV